MFFFVGVCILNFSKEIVTRPNVEAGLREHGKDKVENGKWILENCYASNCFFKLSVCGANFTEPNPDRASRKACRRENAGHAKYLRGCRNPHKRSCMEIV